MQCGEQLEGKGTAGLLSSGAFLTGWDGPLLPDTPADTGAGAFSTAYSQGLPPPPLLCLLQVFSPGLSSQRNDSKSLSQNLPLGELQLKKEVKFP